MTAHPREPYVKDHERSVARRMERGGSMPRSLEGLIAWYIGEVADELPERLHKGEVWSDRVSLYERSEGIRAQGGSALGSPAYSGGMRLRLEAPATIVDEDGSFLHPMRAALEEMRRNGHRFLAGNLHRLAQREGDWRGLADAKGWEHEEMAFYLQKGLEKLWFCYRTELPARRIA